MGFLNKIIENLLMKVIGPLTGKMGKGWKTLTGLALLAAVAASHALIEGRGLEPDTLDTIQGVGDTVEWIALALFGVGVYHKVAAAEPEKMSATSLPPRLLKEKKAGDPISAADFNELVKALNR